jgi:hypothetical protein
LGLSVVLALYISELEATGCENSFLGLIVVVAYIMLAVNIVGVLLNRCRAEFSKIAFYIFFSGNLILSGIILVVAFAGYGQSNVCANSKLFYKFAVAEVIFIVVMTLLILFSSFYWIQRYSNSPGNLAWLALFLGFDWSKGLASSMTAIGLIGLSVSLITIFSNGIAAWKGITTTVKKVVVGCWTVCLLLILTNEIVAIVTYFSNSWISFNDVVAKKLLLTFLALNMVEFAFWIYGLMTLRYENGDPIRDSLLNFGKQDSFEEEEREVQPEGKGYGTIK